MHHNNHGEPKGFVKWFLSWRGVVLTVVLAAVSAYLVTAHKEHLAVAFTYVASTGRRWGNSC